MSSPDTRTRSEPGTERASRSVLVVVFTTILIDFIGFSVLIPVGPLHAARRAATPFQVGLILTVYALAQLLFLPAWGWVSDRIGRRPVILFSLFGTVGSFLVLVGAETIEMIYIARILAGFFAASIGTAQAVVTDVTPPADRARGMGVIGSAFGVGMIVGPMLGGALAVINEKLPFQAIAALAAANFVLAWFRLPESRPRGLRRPTIRELRRSLVPTPLRLIAAVHETRIGLFLYLFFHLFTAFAVLEAMITLYLGRRFGVSELEIAAIFAAIGAVLAVTQGFLLRRLVIRFSETQLVAAGIVTMGIGLGAVSWAPTFTWFWLIGPIIAFGNGITFPSFTSLYSKACEASQSGELLAQSQSMATAGRIVGSGGAGLVMQKWSLGAPFAVAGVMMLVALAVFAATRRILVDGSNPH